MSNRVTSVAAIIAFASMAFATNSPSQAHDQTNIIKPQHHIKVVKTSAAANDFSNGALKSKLPASSTYTFTLNSFRITDTRSVHNDTDFVSVGVVVGNKPPITVPARAMGDVNNGSHQVNLSIPNVSVAPGEKVAFSYSILNTGHDKDSVEKALTPVAGNAAGKAVAAAVEEIGSIFGVDPKSAETVGKQAGAWLGPKLANIIFANCDGSVAAGDHVLTGAALGRLTRNGHVLQQTDDNHGTDSPVGCGSNSRYYVTWSVAGPGQNSATSQGSSGQHGVETGRHHLQN